MIFQCRQNDQLWSSTTCRGCFTWCRSRAGGILIFPLWCSTSPSGSAQSGKVDVPLCEARRCNRATSKRLHRADLALSSPEPEHARGAIWIEGIVASSKPCGRARRDAGRPSSMSGTTCSASRLVDQGISRNLSDHRWFIADARCVGFSAICRLILVSIRYVGHDLTTRPDERGGNR
jgi:hypothetical protein